MNVGFVSKNGRGWLSKSWNENIIVVLTHPSKKFTNILLSQLSFSARSTWAASTSITKSGFAEERRHTVVDIDWMDWDLEVCDIMQCWWRSISKRDPLVHQSMKNAAICDTWCELQPQAIVNHRIFERTAPPLRDGIPGWVSWIVSGSCVSVLNHKHVSPNPVVSSRRWRHVWPHVVLVSRLPGCYNQGLLDTLAGGISVEQSPCNRP